MRHGINASYLRRWLSVDHKLANGDHHMDDQTASSGAVADRAVRY
jgi:hypothetical protein